MRLAEYFFNENSNTPTANEHDTPFRNKSTWNPPNDRERALETFLDAVKLDITTGKPKTIHDNLTAIERHAIRQLKKTTRYYNKTRRQRFRYCCYGQNLVHRRIYATDNLLTPKSTDA